MLLTELVPVKERTSSKGQHPSICHSPTGPFSLLRSLVKAPATLSAALLYLSSTSLDISLPGHPGMPTAEPSNGRAEPWSQNQMTS